MGGKNVSKKKNPIFPNTYPFKKKKKIIIRYQLMHEKQFPRWIKPRGQQTQNPSSPTHKKVILY